MAFAHDELDRLLEAFAADRLTPEERRQLHAAAMLDKRLLRALADEQALKEVLKDPGLRARLLLELQTPGDAWRNHKRWWRQPRMWIAVGSVLSGIAAIVIGTELYQERIHKQPPNVAHQDSGPTLPVPPVATPTPESNQVTPVPNNDVTPPPSIANKPDTDRPAPRRIPAPFTGPLIEERVRDDEIRVPAPMLKEQDPERPPPKTSNSRARAKTNPRTAPGPEPNAPQTVHEEAMPAPPAEPASPAQQQAALSTPAPPFSSARAVFYAKADQVASATALQSAESDATSGLETEHQPLMPSTASLAIRYSLVIAGPDGNDHEVDTETPVSLSDRPRLAVQTNQDGYLLVTEVPSTSELAIAPSATPKPVHARTTVLFPLAGLITDPVANPALRLQLTFTSGPLNSKYLMTQTPRPPQEERVAPAPGGPAEHAVYVAVRGSSETPMLTVELKLSQRP